MLLAISYISIFLTLSAPDQVDVSPSSIATSNVQTMESSRITGGHTVGQTTMLPTSTSIPTSRSIPTASSLSSAQLDDIIVGAVVALLALAVLGVFLITVIVCIKIRRLPKSDTTSGKVNPESRSESPLIPLESRTISTPNSSAGATPDHQGVIAIESETHLGASMDNNSASLIKMHDNPSYTTLPGMQPEYDTPTSVTIPHHSPHEYETPVSNSEDVVTAADAIYYSDMIYEEVQ